MYVFMYVFHNACVICSTHHCTKNMFHDVSSILKLINENFRKFTKIIAIHNHVLPEWNHNPLHKN